MVFQYLTRNVVTNTFVSCCKKEIRSFQKGIFWDAVTRPINWRKTWLTPFKYCINNKVKEVHFKILHTIYHVNSLVSKYSDTEDLCTFRKNHSETLTHLFYICPVITKLWEDIVSCLFSKNYLSLQISLKDVIVFCNYKENPSLEFICNLVILIAKF